MESKRSQSYLIYTLLFLAIIAMVYMNIKQGAVNDEPLTINEVARDIQQHKVKCKIQRHGGDILSVTIY